MSGSALKNAVPLGRHDILGLAFAAEAGIISLIADSIVIFFLLRYFLKRHVEYKKPTLNKNIPKKSIFAAASINLFVLSLFVSNLLKAVAQSLDAIWVMKFQVEPGKLCNAQRMLETTGGVASTFAIAAITIHAICIGTGVPKRWKFWDLNRCDPFSTRFAFIVVGLSWIVALYFGLALAYLEDGPTSYLCWIRNSSTFQRGSGIYLFYIIGLPLSFVLFIANLVFKNDPGRSSKTHSWHQDEYVAIFAFVTGPSIVSRWLPNGDDASTTGLAVESAILFALAGLSNAGYFFYAHQKDLRVIQDGEPSLPDGWELDKDTRSIEKPI